MSRRLSRRDVLKATGVAAGATLMAACAPPATPQRLDQTPTAEQRLPTPTAVSATSTPDPAARMTPYSLDPGEWIAWQFDQPETGAGMVQAFRREQNAEAVRTFPLRGLDPEAEYVITNLDLDAPVTMGGQGLLADGLSVEIRELPGSALLTYKRVA